MVLTLDHGVSAHRAGPVILSAANSLPRPWAAIAGIAVEEPEGESVYNRRASLGGAHDQSSINPASQPSRAGDAG